MSLSQRIRQLRKENKLTAKEFGKIFNIAESTVSLYENEKRTPNKDLIIKMARYFNVSADFLLGLTDIRTVNYASGVREGSGIDIYYEMKKLLSSVENEEYILYCGKPIKNNLRTVLKSNIKSMLETGLIVNEIESSLPVYEENSSYEPEAE